MNFKQIATYDNYLLANMTMGLMTENDIKCQMKDEHIITMDPLLNAAVGGIKLLVEEKDYDRALDPLSRMPEFKVAVVRIEKADGRRDTADDRDLQLHDGSA